MIVGGAQENTLLTVADQHHLHGDDVTLLTGPALGPEGCLLDRATSLGVKFEVVPALRRSIHPWRDWRSYRALVKRLRQMQPDIVHTHSSKAGILGRAAADKLRRPAVHTIHGAAFHYGQNALLYRSFRRAEKWAAKRTAKFISVCHAMTDQYVAAGIAPREKYVTIHSGMDVEPFLRPPRDPQAVRDELGLAPQHVVIGKVARLFPLKGHEFVLRAARTVIDRCPNVRFLLIGDGILRPEFEQDIRRQNMQKHFLFTGLVPPDKVPELIHATDIVVHASLWEGLARVLPQALIAGKPVISYDVDGAREVVLPGETGFLLPPQSVDELAEAIVTLAEDSELRQRLGSTGRARFTEQFRHETMTRRIREVYAEVLDQFG